MNSFFHKLTNRRSVAAKRCRPVAWAGLLTLGLFGCAAPMVHIGATPLRAQPNPSTDGAYTVLWAPVAGATKYRLFEDGELAFEGYSLSHAVTGKPDGSYNYSLTYCVVAFGIEACQLGPTQAELTVRVANQEPAAQPPEASHEQMQMRNLSN